MPKQKHGVILKPEDVVTLGEVKSLFQKLLEFVKEAKTRLEGLFETFKQEVQANLETRANELLEANNRTSGAVEQNKALMYSESRTIQRLIEQQVNDVRGEIPMMPDMEAEHEMIETKIAQLEAKIPVIPPQFDPSNIFQELTDLVATVEELEKKIEELTNRPVGRLGSGGTSAPGVATALGFIGKTETPTGDIDGVNTVYTVLKPINFIFSYMLNGEAVGSGNYTIAGNTITWATAPPAAYSGKDHEIRYV